MMYGWHSGGFMLLGLLAVLAAIAIVVVAVAGRSGQAPPPGPTAPPPRNPEQIVADRYARGEIDEDEYSRHIAVLRGTNPPRVPQ
jgi:putative membrane protein